MPLRGSVQFLLLSLRPRTRRGLGIGAAVVVLLLVGAVQLKDALPSLGHDGLAQALRQSVWEQALADQSKGVYWPWDDLTVNMSLAPAAKVRRLGLSAAMLNETPISPEAAAPARDHAAHAKADKHTGPQDSQEQGDVALSDVTVGDSITFTAADGATCIYRVTGHRVVDPHLAESEAERFGGEAALFECDPLESLIRQATQGAQSEPQAAPEPADDQQKL